MMRMGFFLFSIDIQTDHITRMVKMFNFYYGEAATIAGALIALRTELLVIQLFQYLIKH